MQKETIILFLKKKYNCSCSIFFCACNTEKLELLINYSCYSISYACMHICMIHACVCMCVSICIYIFTCYQDKFQFHTDSTKHSNAECPSLCNDSHCGASYNALQHAVSALCHNFVLRTVGKSTMALRYTASLNNLKLDFNIFYMFQSRIVYHLQFPLSF